MKLLRASSSLDEAYTDFSGTIAQASTSQQLLPANRNRASFYIQNVDASATLWINYTNAAAASNGSFKLPPGAFLSEDGNFVSTEKINIFSTTQGAQFTCKEGGPIP